jgi:hypothetical protein
MDKTVHAPVGMFATECGLTRLNIMDRLRYQADIVTSQWDNPTEVTCPLCLLTLAQKRHKEEHLMKAYKVKVIIGTVPAFFLHGLHIVIDFFKATMDNLGDSIEAAREHFELYRDES